MPYLCFHIERLRLPGFTYICFTCQPKCKSLPADVLPHAASPVCASLLHTHWTEALIQLQTTPASQESNP